MNIKKVNICGYLFNMSLVDGGVLFSKSDSSNAYSRVMFEYKDSLWRISEISSISRGIPLCHIEKMKILLDENIGLVEYLRFK